MKNMILRISCKHMYQLTKYISWRQLERKARLRRVSTTVNCILKESIDWRKHDNEIELKLFASTWQLMTWGKNVYCHNKLHTAILTSFMKFKNVFTHRYYFYNQQRANTLLNSHIYDHKYHLKQTSTLYILLAHLVALFSC